jgi:hypothetical protein
MLDKPPLYHMCPHVASALKLTDGTLFVIYNNNYLVLFMTKAGKKNKKHTTALSIKVVY